MCVVVWYGFRYVLSEAWGMGLRAMVMGLSLWNIIWVRVFGDEYVWVWAYWY